MSAKDLAKYRYEMAVEKLKAAKVLEENGFYKDSISRSYYAIFTGARSLLALEKKDSTKHSGIISLFRGWNKISHPFIIPKMFNNNHLLLYFI